MEPIKLQFTASMDDLVRVTRRLQLEGLMRPTSILSMIVVALLLAYLVDSALDGYSNKIYVLVMALTLIAFLPLFLWLGPWMAARRSRKYLESMAAIVYEFADDYVFVKDPNTELKQNWSVYSRVITTKDHYILAFSLNKLAGRFVPRRAFESPEQEAAFRELLARKLNFKG